MTTETYLDITLDAAGKAGKRPIRPKLLKLSDVTIPHRSRKKTKVKSKDRSLSNMRERIYDDPAYTDDISHLANPLRRNSCSGKSESSKPSTSKAALATGSSSLGKRSKLTKEFLQYASKQNKTRNGASGVGGVCEREHDMTSSSDDEQQQQLGSEATGLRSKNPLGRRGRSLERGAAAEKIEKKSTKRERSAQKKRNQSLDSQQQQPLEHAAEQQDYPSSERAHARERKQQQPHMLPKQFSDGPGELWNEATAQLPADQDELFSLRSVSKDSNASSSSKMQIGRRFLKGEIGIKSFNYYLIKEGLKSSKKFVEKQRNTLSAGLSGKKLTSRSEENIYEEIFFKDAPPSDEDNQNHSQSAVLPPPQPQQQVVPPEARPPAMQPETPNSQCSENAVYTDCELCMQQCNKENCEYCLEIQRSQRDTSARVNATGAAAAMRTYVSAQPSQLTTNSMPRNQNDYSKQQMSAQSATAAAQTENSNADAGLPAAHILEFQSYNPNNPGVYKIETTPVAITGEYNPILQFQQSTSSTATTTPSEQHFVSHQPHTHTPQQQQQHQLQQQQQQLQQQFMQPKAVPQAYVLHSGPALLANQYAMGGVVPLRRATPLTVANGQQQYVIGYANTQPASHRMHAKSSSSSDSLQQHNKYNTMTRLETQLMHGNAADSLYISPAQMHPLMYAASRPIGGSQILVDSYEPPQMYKSDSKASILSEYSLRSSDNSHRFTRYHQRYGGSGTRGEISDSSLGDSLFSYAPPHRRYFGSTESCRFPYDCRRCSLDGGGIGVGVAGAGAGGMSMGVGMGAGVIFLNSTPATAGAATGGGIGVAGNAAASAVPGAVGADKCTYSDNCRYECRNCDCSSSYFSSDFDDVYGNVAGTGVSGIPRKTAAGILQSSDFEQRQQEQLDRKQSKYAQDFFKHVNDVKRSIYQSEMQRNNNLDGSVPPKAGNAANMRSEKNKTTQGSPQRKLNSQAPGKAGKLDLNDEELVQKLQTQHKPTPAPRTTLQQQQHSITMPNTEIKATPTAPPKASQRRSQTLERREYPSLDRMVAAATGAIPKTSNASASAQQPTGHSPKTKRVHEPENTVRTQTQAREHLTLQPLEGERYLNVGDPPVTCNPTASTKRHHRASTAKQAGGTAGRRKDIPAPPPPSPATYSDLQELQANMECLQDDTKMPSISAEEELALAELAKPINAAANNNGNVLTGTGTKERTKKATTKEQMTGALLSGEERTTKDNVLTVVPQQNDAINAADANSNILLPNTTTTKTGANAETMPNAGQAEKMPNDATIVTNFDVDEDDVFYDARSEDSAGAATSTTSAASNRAALKHATAATAAKTTSIIEEPPAGPQCKDMAAVARQAIEIDKLQANDFNEGNHSVKRKKQKHSAAEQTINSNNNNNKQSMTPDNVQAEVNYKKLHATARSSSTTSKASKHNDGSADGKATAATAAKLTSHKDMHKINDMQLTTTKQTTDATVEASAAAVATIERNENNCVAMQVEEQAAQAIAKTANATNCHNNNNDNNNLNNNENNNGAGVGKGDAALVQQHGGVHKEQREPRDTHHKDSNKGSAATPTTTPTAKKDIKYRKYERSKSRQRKISPATAKTTTATTTTITISCDTCCQLEYEQQQQQQQKHHQPSGEQHGQKHTKVKTHKTQTKDAAQRGKSESRRQTIAGATTAEPCAASTTAGLTAHTTSAVNKHSSNVEATCCAVPANSVSTTPILTAQQQSAQITPTPITAAAVLTAHNNNSTIVAGLTATVETATATAASSSAPAPAAAAAVTTMANMVNSFNSDSAGVTTLTNSLTGTVPTITTTQPPQDTKAAEALQTQAQPQPAQTADECTLVTKPNIGTAAYTSGSNYNNSTKRPQLQRQDYSCLDSSEAQSDDSHLTRDSITRESQNDELSSSTHDKIDISALPLPALPPKKRRTRSRASPSKYHNRRHAIESEQPTSETSTATARAQHSGSADDTNVSGNAAKTASTALGSDDTADEPHLSAFQKYIAKRRESLEASSRSFNEKLAARKMHYHMGGSSGSGVGASGNSAGGANIPTYLFGEHYYAAAVPPQQQQQHQRNKSPGQPNRKEEIYLNKSGWVQVNTKRGANPQLTGYRRQSSFAQPNGDLHNPIRVIQIDNTRRSDLARQALLQHQHSTIDGSGGYMSVPKFVGSKVEELIQRNESRLNAAAAKSPATRDPTLRPGYRIIDPHLASILNERPGFLPVKNRNDADSPPPITPILSPPPAFQDNGKAKNFIDWRKQLPMRPKQTQLLPQQQQQLVANNGTKGMVFSRSFEYDTRRPAPSDTYVETFSRSFDGNLERERPPLQRERSPNFSTLTGNSPNYLTKREGGGSSGSLRSRDNSPKYQQPQTTAYLSTTVKEAPPAYNSVANSAVNAGNIKYSPRSRHHDRSFERSKSHNVMSRSRKSQFTRIASSGPTMTSRFRSFDAAINQRLNSCDSGARSDLSNDELDIDDDDHGSTEFLNTINYHHVTSPFKTQRQRSLTPDRNELHSSSSSLRKQRSITPESRSLTPEERRKKGSQVSLIGSRQSSSSRSNTLERKPRHEQDIKTPNISRSSSSSSYSGREHDTYLTHGTHAAHMPHGAHSMLNAAVGCGGPVAGTNVVNASGAVVGSTNVGQHRRSLGRTAKQNEEHRIRRSRSLQLSERSPNRAHKSIVCVGQPHANVVLAQPTTKHQQYQQQVNARAAAMSNGPANTAGAIGYAPPLRNTGKSQSIVVNINSNKPTASSTRIRPGEPDKSRSFDFDYNNYTGSLVNAHANAPNISSASAQNMAMRLDFDKSRSFDEDYRDVNLAGSSSGSNQPGVIGKRYLQAQELSGGATARLRKSSPVTSSCERNTRSPQSSGSSTTNLHLTRQSTSPQNYASRLCDHELNYDMRKSLDRSPIMDFRRGDSIDYELPQLVLRNRETINAGGNSELNFLNSDAHIYEHPTTTQQSAGTVHKSRGSSGNAMRHTQSPSEPQYILENADLTGDYRNEYHYRQAHAHAHAHAPAQTREARSSNRVRRRCAAPLIAATTATTTTNLKSSNATTPINANANAKPTSTQTATASAPSTCSFWPHCGACCNTLDNVTYTNDLMKSANNNNNNKLNFPNISRECTTTLQKAQEQRPYAIQRNNSITLPPHTYYNKCSNNNYKPTRTTHEVYRSNANNISTVCVNVSEINLELMEDGDAITAANDVDEDDDHHGDDDGDVSNMQIAARTMSTLPLMRRNASQTATTEWTLLCSGSQPAQYAANQTNMTTTTANGAKTTVAHPTLTAASKTIPRNFTTQAGVDNGKKVPRAGMPLTASPLTATTTITTVTTPSNATTATLVLLGNCEMPMTRDFDFHYVPQQQQQQQHKQQHATTDSAATTFARQRSNSLGQASTSNYFDSNHDNNAGSSSNNNHNNSSSHSMCYDKYRYADGNSNSWSNYNNDASMQAAQSTKSTVTAATTTTTTTTTIRTPLNVRTIKYLNRMRSNSLPEIFSTLSQGVPGTTNYNGAIISGVQNGFATNLSHQMRAVSSPSLTDATHEPNDMTKTATQQRSSTLSDKNNAIIIIGNGSSNHQLCRATANNNNSSSNSSTSSVGVLQKFKRTLTNFNGGNHSNTHHHQHHSNSGTGKCQQQQQQQQQFAAHENSTNYLSPHQNGQQHHTAAVVITQDAIDGTAANVTTAAGGGGNKHRFGPLIWRSSKERRKTKFNRRDKCNSGDSGIQIELENDEQFARVFATTNKPNSKPLKAESQQNIEMPKITTIRRTNSAKAGAGVGASVVNAAQPHEPTQLTEAINTSFQHTLNAKAKIFKKIDNCPQQRLVPESLPARSVSQPNGLESYGIGRCDLADDSDDSDSVTSSHDDAPSYYPIYAEVLYSFNAAGPQELSLVRGSVIEVLRKEIGPWWFGRTKKEDASLVEEILDPELGWFPKEFVRVINYPETDGFFLSYLRQQQHHQQQQQQAAGHAVLKEENITIDSNQASNVTTIIIDSPPPSSVPPPSSAPTTNSPLLNGKNTTCTSSISHSSCLTKHTMHEHDKQTAAATNGALTTLSSNLLINNAELLRRSAIRELLDTEVNYVKLLQSICEGYLPAMSKRIDIFSPNSIRLIFSNIAAIYKFQKKFLDTLRQCIEQNQIAKVFLKMHKGFLCYSTYCNAYPRALIELETYDRVKDAKIILENCRESENLAELPLSAHLLAPVQRICRYPLHLGELIKTAALSGSDDAAQQHKNELLKLDEQEACDIDLPDTREAVEMALEAMKSITEAVNEGKRHSETIARHQASFQNFKGPPLHLHSTRFFLQTDATRQKQNLWNSSYTLFLFDNQLIYCKRDIIKRSQYIYKGRIFLDRYRIVNVRDGKMFGHTIKNSLRIYCEARDKWYDFSFRSANRKQRFLSTLALERQFSDKQLYISEMTGYEYAYEERKAASSNSASGGVNGAGDYSDQSDYELPDSEHANGGGGRLREYLYDTATGTSASGESSVPDSPAKSAACGHISKSYCETLPKKSHSRTDIAQQLVPTGGNGGGISSSSSSGGVNNNVDYQTSSLGRRRLGNWFRKPKSTTCTPHQSPTHKAPLGLGGILLADSANEAPAVIQNSTTPALITLTAKAAKSDTNLATATTSTA